MVLFLYLKYFLYICNVVINFNLKNTIMADKLANYELYLKKLNQIGIDTTKLAEDFGEQIAEATFSVNSDNGLAYDGALINTILYKLTPYAIKLNELYPQEIQVDKNSLVKVCLLHQIAKAVRLTKNDNEWEIKNRGLVYKYTTNQPSIRTGLHSLVIAQNCGIQFTPEEAEAMTVNDRDLTDDQARWHSSLMASIVRQASEMVYLEANNTPKNAE